MTGEDLFTLVHSLTKREKTNFTTMMIRSNTDKSDYYLLYRILKNAEELNESNIRSKNQFRLSQKYNNARRKLADKIIESLVLASKAKVYPKTYILIAIRKGAIDLAKRKLREEVQKATSEKDWNYLNYLVGFSKEIQYATGIIFEVPDSIPFFLNRSSFSSETIKLRQLIQRVKAIGLDVQNNTSLKFVNLERELKIQDPQEGLNGYLFRKAKALFDRITNGSASAKVHFEEIVTYLESNSFPLSNGYLIKELSTLAILNCRLGNWEAARASLLKISTIAPDDLTFRRRKLRLLCKVQTTLSFSQISADYSDTGYNILINHREYFSQLEYSALIVNYVKIRFIYGDLTKAKELIRDLKSTPRNGWSPIEWIINLLYFLIVFEDGAVQAAEIQFEKLKSTAKKIDLKTPQLIISFLSQVFVMSRKELSLHWESFASQISTLIHDPRERNLNEQFMLASWVKSYSTKSPLRETYFESRIKEDNWLSHSG